MAKRAHLEEETMWYVIQVPTGQEEQIIEEAKKYEVTEFLIAPFTPRWEDREKLRGQWTKLSGVLFPGYTSSPCPSLPYL